MPLNDDLFAQPLKVQAPSPSGDLISLGVSVERVRQLAALGRRSDIFAFFYNLCGLDIPVNNFGYHEKDDGNFPDNWGGLKHSHAIYRGIKRPYKEAERDGDVYIYVVQHRYVYQYISNMVCVAKRAPAPARALFVAYVVFEGQPFDKGVVQNWEWVVADPENPKYPKDFNNRYEEKVWENG
jgi:hypothetical protein